MKSVGRYELALILAVLIIVSGLWGFIELADEVREGKTQSFDEWAVRALREPGKPAVPRGPLWLPDVARDITSLGSYAVLTLVTSGVAVFLLLQGKRAAMWLVLIATIGGALMSSWLKMFFARERPDVPHSIHIVSASFPSGHAMVSAVVYLSLAVLLARVEQNRLTKVYSLCMGMLLTLLVGISRIYLGVHYPTDVLAGWTAGLLWALLCWLVAWHLQRRGKLKDDRAKP
jgi:undecaprenyl-diphosphatase